MRWIGSSKHSFKSGTLAVRTLDSCRRGRILRRRLIRKVLRARERNHDFDRTASRFQQSQSSSSTSSTFYAGLALIAGFGTRIAALALVADVVGAAATAGRVESGDDAPSEIRFHDLRHTHASLLVAHGVPIKAVTERLGHSHSAFTMHTYQHLLPGISADASARFAGLVATAGR